MATNTHNFLSTGFEALDNLLGGRGIQKGSVSLIRGEPGTGKTTFAVQIANYALRHAKFNLVFVCVEDIPEITLGQITQSYWDIDYEEYFNFENKILLGTNELMQSWEMSISNDNIDNYTGSRSLELQADLRSTPNKRPEEFLKNLWLTLTPDTFDDKPLLIVIDSLNSLIYRIQNYFHLFDTSYGDRRLVGEILKSFHDWSFSTLKDSSIKSTQNKVSTRPTVIFTAENTSPDFNRAAASYGVDIVIELQRRTPVFITPTYDGKTSEWKEDLLFCQVIKGRGLPIQRRSSCYEFVKSVDKKGIEFYPTYAAQGLVSLFFENEPQREVINTLRTVDMPAAYPEVIVQEFNRSALQRMFAVRRYEKRIPPRHPMLLSHIDEYWISVLKDAKLLYPLPAEKLRLFSRESRNKSDNSTEKFKSIVSELSKFKSKHFQVSINDELHYYAVPQMGNIGMLIWRKDVLNQIGIYKAPKTWEEMEMICLNLYENDSPFRFLIETRTYDTLIATFLEMCWSHGCFWKTIRISSGKNRYRLKIVYKDGSHFDQIINAASRLKRWVHDYKIIPNNSSVDPRPEPQQPWVFARHWYSTWIDLCTKKDPTDTNNLLVTYDDIADFGVAQIPISESYFETQKKQNEPEKHHSCSGEWYLALQANSENVELGIDLINNLMSARKVTERAFSGAELPLLEEFYLSHGSIKCPHTDKTFKEIRDMFAKDSQDRSVFAQYRWVGRNLNAAIHTILTDPNISIENLFKESFNRIQEREWTVNN